MKEREREEENREGKTNKFKHIYKKNVDIAQQHTERIINGKTRWTTREKYAMNEENGRERVECAFAK